MKYPPDKYSMKGKKTYHSPEQWEEAVGVLLMTLPDSQGEITDDPATEPAMSPGRDDKAEAGDGFWGNLW